MALIETFARLCGTGQTITGTALSTNAFDLGANRTGKTLGGGRLVVARFGVVTALTDAVESTVIDLQIVNINGSTGTLAPTCTTAQINTTTNTITSVAHGLANSTAVVITAATTVMTLSPAYVAGRIVYVRNATADTFQLSPTPGGPLYDITATGTGDHTFTEQMTFLVSAQSVPLQRLGADCFLELAIPPPAVSREAFAGRYILARFAPTNSLDTGALTCDLVSGFSMDGQPRNKQGYVTA